MRFGWGIIGLGTIAGTFAEGLKNSEGGELVAVASSSNDRARDFAERFGVEKPYGSYQELYDDESVDIVYISTLNPDHLGCVLDALANGKHVLCEKPLGLNTGEVEKMFKTAEKRGLFLMEALWTRFLPAYIKAKEWVKVGGIGGLRRVTADFCWLAGRDHESRILSKEKGGGAVLDLGVYVSGIACDMFESPLLGLNSSVYYGPTGVDEAVSASLDFGEERGGIYTHLSLARVQTTLTSTEQRAPSRYPVSGGHHPRI